MQIAIVVYPGLTVLDAVGPYEVLRFVPGAEIRFVWTEPGPVIADSGMMALSATHSFEETPQPDIVLVAGSGIASASTARDRALIEWLQQVHPTTQWTTSVCTGSLILASAGILNGVRATTHWSALLALKALGAEPVSGERVVRVGKIVTAAGVSAGIDMALWLLGQVAGDDVARAAQILIEYDPQPPYDVGSFWNVDATIKRSVLAIGLKEASAVIVNDPAMLLDEAAGWIHSAWRAVLIRIRRRRSLFAQRRRSRQDY